MRSSPRRPLILKRRRLNLPCEDVVRGAEAPEQGQTPMTAVTEQQGQSLVHRIKLTGTPEPSRLRETEVRGTPEPSLAHRWVVSVTPDQNQHSEAVASPNQSHCASLATASVAIAASSPAVRVEAAGVSPGIRIMGHPTIPNTQLVVIPPHSDVESIIQALTVRGKESGPNKFILITGSASFHAQAEKLGFQSKGDEMQTLQIDATSSQTTIVNKKVVPQEARELDISLTNIPELGKASPEDQGPHDIKTERDEKENHTPKAVSVMVEEEVAVPPQKWQLSISERPPYSYMALIQFAINSTPSKRMTLKDIYTWIEEHFPYFKHVAKPGWKNSIRHNLSLHDMFVRESPGNNKISYWTIHPQANRCLTLDQVFKATDSASSVCNEPQPKRLIPELGRSTQCAVTSVKAPERRMKPLLPRIDSYLIPVQFPVTQPVIFSPLEFCSDPGPSTGLRCSKRVKIAPKVPIETKEPLVLPSLPAKVDSLSPNVSTLPPSQCKQMSGSRRKQQLVTPRSREPELVLPDSSGSDSGLDTDFSFLQDTQAQEGTTQLTKDEGYSFKTPIKKILQPPSSSTPSKPADGGPLQPWEAVTPQPTDPLPEFSPVRIPLGSALTPYKDSFGALSFGETPFKDLPYFGSPSDLMGDLSPASPQPELLGTPSAPQRQKRCSKELQVGGSANRSLLEGLVLDTTDESLSKILLDISFSGLEEDNGLGVDTSYWGQLLSELR